LDEFLKLQLQKMKNVARIKNERFNS